MTDQRKSWRKPYRLNLVYHEDRRKRDRQKRDRQERGGKQERGTQLRAPMVAPKGWNYQSMARPPYGSMTCSGISSLTICRAALVDLGKRGSAGMAEIDDAIRSGYAWLGATFTVRANAGYSPKYQYHRYYYLYGLERACELGGVAEIHGRDWYFEGAMQLMAWQRKDGSFEPAEHNETDSTCFAILFLKKASLPVYTGR